MERIQKILARGGVASRRAAEALITAGRVRVNGRVVTELGVRAGDRDRVEVDGKRVVAEMPVYIALHKPRGVVSTMSDPEGRPTVRELLTAIGARVYPVGRLDFATSGVLLATNDGAFAEGLLHPRRAVPKTYVVKVAGVMQPADLDQWRTGVELEDGRTLPAEAKLLRHEGDKTWFELTIREGRNQQIRRMGEATGFPVMRLARVRFAEVAVDGLRAGQWRVLTRDELVSLKKAYGVPRSMPSPASAPRAPSRPQRRPIATRGAAGRAARAFGAERAQRDDGNPGRDATAPRGGRAPSPRGEGGWTQRDGRGQRAALRESPRRESGTPRRDPPRPGYGGGAPGRGAQTWGSGARRSAAPSESDGWPTEQVEHGGRFGRTRTTGTAGGVGAAADAPRVKGRRG